MADDRKSADAGFLRVFFLLKEAKKAELKALEKPECARGLLKGASKRRADAMVLLMDGLIETAQP